MALTVEKVIEIASNEVGYLEKKSNSNLDSKTANAGSNNYTKYWRDIEPDMNGNAWCNCFVNWCFVKAYGTIAAKSLLCTDKYWSFYTPTSSGYFKNKKQWYTSNPKKGDIIYFKNSVRIHHVGIVYKVDSSKVYTIEGNTSGGSAVIANGGGVCYKSYSLSNSNIAGYGRPKYEGAATTNTTTTTTSTVNKYVKKGQEEAVKFTGKKCTIDGDRGPETRKMAAMVLQTAINKDYKAGLVVDGDFGTKSKTALGSHYVEKGEKQYMVTAAEILLYLLGKNPNGVEYPGEFGSGLVSAAGKSKITASDFLSYLK